MSDPVDLSELRRQIERSSPKHGPGRVVKLERAYAKELLAQIERLSKPIPCEVMIAPATRFGIGVTLSTVVNAIFRREGLSDEYALKLKRAGETTTRKLSEALDAEP